MNATLNEIDFDSCIEDIEYTHKFTSILIDNMVKLSNKTSKVRDMGDEIVKTLMEYAENDDCYDKQFLNNLKNYSNCLSGVEDSRDAQIDEINNKIVTNLTRYNERLKYAKNDVKLAIDLHNKELNKHKKSRNSSIGRQLQFFKLDEPVSNEKSVKEAQKIKEKIGDYMNKFETDKYKNILEFLKEFALIQLKFHNQAVKLFTASYKYLLKNNKKSHENSVKNKYESPISNLNLNENTNYKMRTNEVFYKPIDYVNKSFYSSESTDDAFLSSKQTVKKPIIAKTTISHPQPKLHSILKTTMNKSLNSLEMDFNYGDSHNLNNLKNNLIYKKNILHHSSTPKLNRPINENDSNDEEFLLKEPKCLKCNCDLESKNQQTTSVSKKSFTRVKNDTADLSSSSSSSKLSIPGHLPQHIKINRSFIHVDEDEEEEDSEDNEMRKELNDYKLILSDEPVSNSILLKDSNLDESTTSKLNTTTDDEDHLDGYLKNLETNSRKIDTSKKASINANSANNSKLSNNIVSNNSTNLKNSNDTFTETQL